MSFHYRSLSQRLSATRVTMRTKNADLYARTESIGEPVLSVNEPLLLRQITPELAATGPNDLPPTLGLKGSFMCALQREQVKFGPKIILNTPPTLSCQEVFSSAILQALHA